MSKLEYFLYNNKKIEYTFVPAIIHKRIIKRITGKTSTVIFLHGFNGPFQNHMDFLRRFSRKGYNAYAINFPGHGGSEKLEQINWEILVDIVVNFIELKKLKKITLAGYSMGGGVALKLLGRLKGVEIEGIKLISPFCHSVDISPHLLVEGAEFAINGYEHQHSLDIQKKKPVGADVAYLLSHYLGMFLEEFSLDLGKNKVPITILTLEHDEVVPENKVVELFKDLPNINLVNIPGLTHDIYYIPRKSRNSLLKALTSNLL